MEQLENFWSQFFTNWPCKEDSKLSKALNPHNVLESISAMTKKTLNKEYLRPDGFCGSFMLLNTSEIVTIFPSSKNTHLISSFVKN